MRRWVRLTAVAWGLICLGSVGAAAPALANPDSSGNGPPPAQGVDGGAASRSGAEERAAALALSEARAKRARYFTPRSLQFGVYSQEELDKVRQAPGLRARPLRRLHANGGLIPTGAVTAPSPRPIIMCAGEAWKPFAAPASKSSKEGGCWRALPSAH